MNTSHFEVCEAPVCSGDSTPNWKKDVVWFPGESICSLKRIKYQKNQARINKLVSKGTFKRMDRYFTAESLHRIGRVTNSTAGARI